MSSPAAKPPYAGHRFPAEVISQAIWLYFRFPLGMRMVEEVLAARGVIVSHETVRGCPPRVVRGAALQAAIASSEDHTGKLPRRRRAASYSDQLVTLCRCFGMRCRRSWFALNGKRGVPGR